MPEVVKRIGPMRLVFDAAQRGDDIYVILSYIGWEGSPFGLHRPQQHDALKRHEELSEFDRYEDKYGPQMLDAAREAIERERADLRREDAERYAEDKR